MSQLSRRLYPQLRKFLGTPALVEHLQGIQFLTAKQEMPGIKLMAACLDVTTAGARLIPLVRGFTHTRRQQMSLSAAGGKMDHMAKDWLQRAWEVQKNCGNLVPVQVENPWLMMREVLEAILSDVVTRRELTPERRALLVDLLRLETDAWQERISRLAGTVNPYRVSSVRRLLPILSRADADISDLRQLVAWISDGLDRQAFRTNGFRALEVVDTRDFKAICQTVISEPSLRPLGKVFQAALKNPVPLEDLGNAVARILALESRLAEEPPKSPGPDYLQIVELVLQHLEAGCFSLALQQEQEKMVHRILSLEKELPDSPRVHHGWSLAGLKLENSNLVLDLNAPGFLSLPWPNGLPCPGQEDPTVPLFAEPLSEQAEEESPGNPALDGAALKNLVMTNITSTSLLLGFLRNPKVVAIPGLVAAVADRTRNPQVIETIAGDRSLYTGFANRDVPLACLRSPCNVSPKILRKFIHVKFVSKVDLRRMANDHAGIRREVIREIEKYLEVLG